MLFKVLQFIWCSRTNNKHCNDGYLKCIEPVVISWNCVHFEVTEWDNAEGEKERTKHRTLGDTMGNGGKSAVAAHCKLQRWKKTNNKTFIWMPFKNVHYNFRDWILISSWQIYSTEATCQHGVYDCFLPLPPPCEHETQSCKVLLVAARPANVFTLQKRGRNFHSFSH